PGGEAPPGQLLQRIVNPGHDENIAVKCADRRPSVGEKIETAEKRMDVPRVWIRLGQSIRDIRAVTGPADTPRLGRFWKMRRAAVAETRKVHRGASGDQTGSRPGEVFLRTAPDGELKPGGIFERRKF